MRTTLTPVRRGRALLLAVALAGVVAAGAFALVTRSPDEQAYVAANIRALDSLPVYPGAHVRETTSSPCASNDTPWARTVGYYTSRVYELPPRARPRGVVAFFRAGGNGWRVDDVFEAASALNLSRGRAYAHVLVGVRTYSVGVDHDSRGCPGA